MFEESVCVWLSVTALVILAFRITDYYFFGSMTNIVFTGKVSNIHFCSSDIAVNHAD